MAKFLVLSFDGNRGWSKDGVSPTRPKGSFERDPGSGVFEDAGGGDLLFIKLEDAEPEYVKDESP